MTWSGVTHGDSEFSLSHARDKTKNIFLCFSTELKTYPLSYFSIYKHYAIDIADPSSMQDACHMNFDLARRGVSAAQWHRSAESEGPRFDSSWALRICLYSTLVTRRKKPYLQIITLLGNRRPINEDELLLIGARWWEEGEGNHLKVRNHNFINLVVSQTDHGHKKLSP